MRSRFALVVAAAFIPAAARAETTKAFAVSAEIATGCAIGVGGANGHWGDIDLGSVVGLAGETASASLVSGGVLGLQIDCTPGAAVDITADQGGQPAGGLRRMAHVSEPTSLAPYQLFIDGSQTPWTTETVTMQFAAGVQRQTLPLRAVVTLSAPTRGGAYSDTVRITVAW